MKLLEEKLRKEGKEEKETHNKMIDNESHLQRAAIFTSPDETQGVIYSSIFFGTEAPIPKGGRDQKRVAIFNNLTEENQNMIYHLCQGITMRKNIPSEDKTDYLLSQLEVMGFERGETQ